MPHQPAPKRTKSVLGPKRTPTKQLGRKVRYLADAKESPAAALKHPDGDEAESKAAKENQKVESRSAERVASATRKPRASQLTINKSKSQSIS